ncbi:centrosomal protein of 44 kDa [Osmerus eperlanus]|uniref:centrosomal protein of 44 kDa n=1 Tax=Osmerus eperlanus TaxID=29151 RepID=UPI002E13024F
MMSTGDLKGCLRKLDTQLRAVKYPRDVDYNGLAKGDASSCLPIVSYVFTSFSPLLVEQLVGLGVELTGKSDLRFTETVYKVLRDQFHYKPSLTKQQFLAFGFSERKVCLLCDIISLVLQRHRELHKASSKPKSRPAFQTVRPLSMEGASRQASSNRPTDSTSSDWPLVQCHIGGAALTPAPLPLDELDEDEEQFYNTAPRDCLREEEGRLAAVEAQLGQCLAGLERLAALEARLELMERQREEKEREKKEEEGKRGTITIDRQSWINLESRVLLLETKLELALKDSSLVTRGGSDAMACAVRSASSGMIEPELDLTKDQTQVQHQTHDQVIKHSSDPEPPLFSSPTGQQENLQERLERIRNMMKETCSLLNIVEPCI